MKRHRSSFVLLLTLSATVALGVLPPSALAGSLLSGYGGPGSGTQALLGSTLVNGGGSAGGPSGGSSGGSSGSALSGGGSSAGGGVAALNGSAHTPGSGSSGQGAGAPGASAAKGRGGALKGANGASGTSAGGSSTYTSAEGPRPAAGTAAARDAAQAPLGFTGTDVLLLAFVLGVLAITMALTRGLARMQQNF